MSEASRGNDVEKERRKRPKAARTEPVWSASEDVQADEGTKALLREFMHSKKLMKTLATFDKEQPRGETTIQSRAVMAELLSLTDAQRRNKEKAAPLKTLLEVTCDDRLCRRMQAEATPDTFCDSDADDAIAAPLKDKQNELETLLADIAQRQQDLAALDLAVAEAAERPSEEKKEKRDGATKEKKKDKKDKKEKGKSKQDGEPGGGTTRSGSKKRDKKGKKRELSIDAILAAGDRHTQRAAATAASSSSSSGRHQTASPHQTQEADPLSPDVSPIPSRDPHGTADTSNGNGTPHDDEDDDSDDYARDLKALSAGTTSAPQAAPHSMDSWGIDKAAPQEAAPAADSPADTADPLHDPMGGPSSFPMPSAVRGRPVGAAAGSRLKNLLCGRLRMPDSWLQQGFHFSGDVPYGMVQNSGGPCGLLAVVQARVIQHLFFERSPPLPRAADGGVQISEAAQREALIFSLSAALFGIADGGSMQLALPPDLDDRQPKTSVDFDSWRVSSIGRDAAAARQAFADNIGFFTERRGLGMLSFLLSAIYTRGGADSVASDMDQGIGSEGSLIVCHQYSSQELVSLLLYGVAHSNVFDGIRDMSSSDSRLILRGVPSRCDIGLLTYQEYTRDVEVGSFLKDPRYPIWLIWNESHYCVAFAKGVIEMGGAGGGGGGGASAPDIFYYDQLGRQGEEYRLTVDPSREVPPLPPNGLSPFMDDILRTRTPWNGAFVDWNGSDPLL